MGFVVILPCRIGSQVRGPGYVLTVEDLRGRAVRAMEKAGYVRYDPSLPEPKSSRDLAGGDGDGTEPSSEWSLKALKAHASELGVEGAEKLKTKAVALEAIAAATEGDGSEEDETSESDDDAGGDGDGESSEDESSSED